MKDVKDMKIEPSRTWLSVATVTAMITTLAAFMFAVVWWAAVQTQKTDMIIEALKDQPEIKKNIAQIQTDIAVLKSQQSSAMAGAEKKNRSMARDDAAVPLTPAPSPPTSPRAPTPVPTPVPAPAPAPSPPPP